MVQFLQFGEGIARSHRAPEKLFKLLDMFETLDQCVPTVNTVFEGDSGLELRARTRELQKLVCNRTTLIQLVLCGQTCKYHHR
jgi:exocyst complex protein 7